MASARLPHKDRLLQLLRYEPETGLLFWLPRSLSEFANRNARICNSWNSANAGQPALMGLNSNGYRHGTMEGRSVLAHRVIWKMMTGLDPNQVDHIDGTRTNNVWRNLRDVDGGGNRRNAARNRRNKSGVSGVSWQQRWPQYPGHWVVHIGTKRVGSFATFELAAAARKSAEAEYGYHKNHGRPLSLANSLKGL